MNLFYVNGTWYLNDSSDNLAANYPSLLSGKVGYIIKRNDEINRYDIVSKSDKSVICGNLTFGELSKMFSKGIAEGIKQIKEIRKEA